MSTEENPSTKKRLDFNQLKYGLQIFRFLKPYQGVFTIGLLFLLFSSMSSLSFPYFAGKLFDDKVLQEAESINQVALYLGLILIAQGIFSYFRIYLFAIVTEKTSADIRLAVYEKLIKLPIPFYDKNRTGELNSRLTNDVSQIQDAMGTTLAEFFRQVLTLIVGVVMISLISGKLTVFMLLTFPVLVVSAIIFGTYIRKLSKKKQDELAMANIVVEETLSAIRLVKAFTNEMFEVIRYGKSLKKSVEVALKTAKMRAVFVSFIITTLFGGIVLVLWYGANLVRQGEISTGELTTFILYTAFIGGAVGGLGDLYSQLQKIMGASERLLTILNEPTEKDITEGSPSEQILNGNIAFNGVSFSYPTREELAVLKDINFQIKGGEKVALIGESGSGKSTITQILLGYYPINSDTVLIDDKRISLYSKQELRGKIGIVPQDSFLFGGTLLENIRYGKPDATIEEVTLAAKQANALSFIETFPEGLHTLVGERGIQLSGGQRQRISIARTILKNPKILILDEATSSLDTESEFVVQQALNTLMEGRTSIIIAHRLSTIQNCDKILVLAKGKIIEQGTHHELLSQEGSYYGHLLKMQNLQLS